MRTFGGLLVTTVLVLVFTLGAGPAWANDREYFLVEANSPEGKKVIVGIIDKGRFGLGEGRVDPSEYSDYVVGYVDQGTNNLIIPKNTWHRIMVAPEADKANKDGSITLKGGYRLYGVPFKFSADGTSPPGGVMINKVGSDKKPAAGSGRTPDDRIIMWRTSDSSGSVSTGLILPDLQFDATEEVRKSFIERLKKQPAAEKSAIIVDFPPLLLPGKTGSIKIGTFGLQDERGSIKDPVYQEKKLQPVDEKTAREMILHQAVIKTGRKGLLKDDKLFREFYNSKRRGIDPEEPVLGVVSKDGKTGYQITGGAGGVNVSMISYGQAKEASFNTAEACAASMEPIEIDVDYNTGYVFGLWRTAEGDANLGTFKADSGGLKRTMRKRAIPGLGNNPAAMTVSDDGTAYLANVESGLFSGDSVVIRAWLDGLEQKNFKAYNGGLEYLTLVVDETARLLLLAGVDKESKQPVIGVGQLLGEKDKNKQPKEKMGTIHGRNSEILQGFEAQMRVRNDKWSEKLDEKTDKQEIEKLFYSPSAQPQVRFHEMR